MSGCHIANKCPESEIVCTSCHVHTFSHASYYFASFLLSIVLNTHKYFKQLHLSYSAPLNKRAWTIPRLCTDPSSVITSLYTQELSDCIFLLFTNKARVGLTQLTQSVPAPAAHNASIGFIYRMLLVMVE